MIKNLLFVYVLYRFESTEPVFYGWGVRMRLN